ncbi:hypothetical protein JS561_14620 [Salmonella enterica subsp. enterica serovar Infantis]|nr:hypothetical protein JS561_14620 [Salmonella enterica subsp. enterica serovar Infantis]
MSSEDIVLEGMTFRVVSPPNASGSLPCILYYHGGCFVSGGFLTHDPSYGNWPEKRL